MDGRRGLRFKTHEFSVRVQNLPIPRIFYIGTLKIFRYNYIYAYNVTKTRPYEIVRNECDIVLEDGIFDHLMPPEFKILGLLWPEL